MPAPTPARKATAKATKATAPKATKAPARKAPARKAAPKAPDYVALAATYIVERKMSRPRGWDRTEILSLLVGWATLPAYGPEALSPEGRVRGTVTGWTVPAGCFTPGQAIDQSKVNTVRAWIETVGLPALAAVGCPGLPTIDRVATMLESDGMVIYRRA